MAEIDNLHVYVLGTAGAGKSKLTAAAKLWMTNQGFDAITVNLDPGAESLPYDPDVDIRDWVRLSDVMEQYELGPNGAQVAAADMLALNAPEIKEIIGGYRADYVLLDTPGQIELWLFRESGKFLTEFLAPGESALCYLLDPFLAKEPSGFVSQMMLAATAQFRFQLPLLNLLSKSDLVGKEDLARVLGWMDDTDTLYDELTRQVGMYHELNLSMLRVLRELGTYTRLTPVSGQTMEGLEDVYSFLQNSFAGGEDIESGVEPPERRDGRDGP
ncbi:MAG TPA: ATP/GTP-binding protein [Candidatus Thermoplasmatota archaeon]|nr:ATP/GTP-binding protein [Candidatus Thermoplasmatota archaeon]